MTPTDQLIAAHLDDALTQEQRAELSAWLRADPANLRTFTAANIREQQLRNAVQARGQLQQWETAHRPRRRALARLLPFTRAPRAWMAAAAVAVLLAVALTWQSVSPTGVPVEVMAAHEARLAGRGRTVQPGDSLVLTEIRLAAGTMRLRLANGVMLDVAGPAEANFEDAMRLRVTRGKFTADVGPDGKGFTIETAQARIVDLGTRFGVDASAGGATDVVVFEGRVEVFQPAIRRARQNRLIARLAAGEAVRLDGGQGARRIVFVVQGWDEADWTTRSEPPAGAIITHVTDNLTETDSRRYYRVSTRGMAAGAPARHTQQARWFPYGGGELPEWLDGADLVETFGVDKWEQNFALTVTLGRPALLCVFQDSRVPAPDWLTRDFTDSGFQLAIKRQADIEPVADVPFNVWTREVVVPGSIVLGAPRRPEAGDRGRMYGVAARALPGMR